MVLKSIPFTDTKNSRELGVLFWDETLRILGSLVSWLAAMALISCPVWIPLLIEYLLQK